MGLLPRVFLVNAAVLAAATAALAFTPLTVSFPVALGEAVILVVASSTSSAPSPSASSMGT